MPDRRSHRGAHPEDEKLFSPAALPALSAAAADFCWLLDRDYAKPAALKLIGDEELSNRRRRQVDAGRLAGRTLLVDGYNVLLTVEAALGGGLILLARDGCFRDMASVHGSYRKVDETVPALELVAQVTAQLGVESCHWYFDTPVSNSGRLKSLIGRLATQHGWRWQVELVYNPDNVLAAAAEGVIATSDSGILNRCGPWLNLARIVVGQRVDDAWIVDFGAATDRDVLERSK